MRLKGIFERHHQLDALERAQAELVDRRGRREAATARVFFDERSECVGASNHVPRRAALFDPLTDGRAFQFARAFRAGQLGVGPAHDAPDLLMVGEDEVGRADHGVEVGVGACDDDGHPLGSPTTAESRTPTI